MKKPAGFTLVELMVTLAVLAIMLSIAAPSFLGMMDDSRATTATNDLVSALQLARSEAIKQRQTITVCRRNTSGSDCDAGTAWGAGWLVRSPQRVLQVWGASNASLTATVATITFNAGGRASTAVTYTVKAGSGDKASCREVTVSATGRVTSKKPETC